MKAFVHRRGLFLLILLGLGIFSAQKAKADSSGSVVIVMSSNLGPYKEALKGFQEVFGHSVPFFILSEADPKIPSGSIIVAIGGKAALYPYPSGHFLIYCLAPGTKLSSTEHQGQILEIHTSPSVYPTISKFKELQPSLKRLTVIWAGDAIQDYIDQKNDIAKRMGVELISDRVRNSDDLPDHLRALKGKTDAIWLPADAAMVTPKNFATIKEFSLANGIPFYVPSDGLVEQGAVASVSASFGEIGALAAQMAHQVLERSLTTDQVFPEKIHYAINLTAAARSGLSITPSVTKQADKVIP